MFHGFSFELYTMGTYSGLRFIKNLNLYNAVVTFLYTTFDHITVPIQFQFTLIVEACLFLQGGLFLFSQELRKAHRRFKCPQHGRINFVNFVYGPQPRWLLGGFPSFLC